MFPESEIRAAVRAALVHEFVVVVCTIRGQEWRTLSPVEREAVVAPFEQQIERATNAAVATARHAYGCGKQHATPPPAPRGAHE